MCTIRTAPESVIAPTNALHQDIATYLPKLRGFALMLTRDRTLADDLVQETIMRALTHAHQFEPGTNFKAWITTILRNSYFNEIRRRRRFSESALDAASSEPVISGGQEERLDVRDFERAFKRLAATQREALVLVGASGFSYEDAAGVAGCSLGTMKSRVSRARLQLRKMLDGGSEGGVPGGKARVPVTSPTLDRLGEARRLPAEAASFAN